MERQRRNPDEIVNGVKDLVSNWMRNHYAIVFAGSDGVSEKERKRYVNHFSYECSKNNYTSFQYVKPLNARLWQHTTKIMFYTNSSDYTIRTYANRYPFLRVIYFKDA